MAFVLWTPQDEGEPLGAEELTLASEGAELGEMAKESVHGLG